MRGDGDDEARRRERRFRCLVEAASQIVWVAGADGAVHTFLGEVGPVLGPAPEQYTGWNFLAIVHPEDRDALVAAMQRALTHSEPYVHEVRVRMPDTSHRYFRCRGVPVRDDAGRVVEWVGMASDVHDRKVAELALRERSAALARTVAELEQFGNATAHDLREPLRTVASYAQLIERRLGDRAGPALRDYVGYIVGAARQMERLTEDIRAFLDLGHVGPLEDVDLGALVDAAATRLGETLAGGRVSRLALPAVRGRRDPLRQLVQQLLDNAVRFRGPAPPAIHVGVRRESGPPTIYVRDNGIGIAPQHLELIFGLFKRLHPRDQYPGSGLGLAMCRKIVASHGGRIWAESPGAGGGATIVFTLNGGG